MSETRLNGKAYRALVAEDLDALMARMPACPERDHIACILRRELRPPAIGRPRKDLDVDRATRMAAQGCSLKHIARTLDVDRNTLRRRLVEAGVWPAFRATR